ncbi:MAG: M16 family metallopeptidase [Armatimonadota bacterium]
MKTNYMKIAVTILLVLAVIAGLLVPAFAENPQIRETMLPNGLKVITKEVHAAPVVAFQVWYRVGSRNEELGKTGLSHLLEHMMFKGTKTLKKGEIDRLMRENGGVNNAGTWKDFTFYYETLSSDKLELAMRIESDRMVNSLIDAKEFKSEMTVVRSELEGHENEPDSLMMYEMYATAFKAHPYQWPTIGWTSDVESMTRDNLYKYYKAHYMPNNAIVVITGDFDTEKALAMVRKYFGSIPKGVQPAKVTAVEPVQLGERRSIVRKVGIAPRVMIGYHIPALGHKDIYPLDVLELVLSSGMSSRLYKSLVDKQLATDAWASSSSSRDPNLFFLGGTARTGVKIEDVESALLAEAERVKNEHISNDELQKALNQLEAQFIYTNDSVTNQAQQLGYFETLHSWQFIDQYLSNAKKVTVADVQAVAKKYLTAKNSTTVTFIPEAPAAPLKQTRSIGTKTLLPFDVAAYRPDSVSARISGSVDNALQAKTAVKPKPAVKTPAAKPAASNTKVVKPTRVVLDNGMIVIIQENRSNPTVAVQGSLNAGSVLDPQGKNGLAQMTAGLLKKGTTTRTADQIAAEEDFVGMDIGFGVDTEYASFSGYSLTKYFGKMLDIMSDVLRNPTFPQDELDKLKSMRLSGLREQEDSTEAMAFRSFYNTVFPAGHPYHQLTLDDDIANTTAIQRDDVLGFYKNHYGPDSVIFVIVGDVDTNQALDMIKARFGGWQKIGTTQRPQIPDAPMPGSITKKVIQMPDKSQVDVVLGYPGGLKRSDPDFYAANVMNFILGGGGALSSRMGNEIRDKMGFVYNVYSYFDASLGAGPWISSLGSNPQNTDKAIKTLVAQIALMRDKGATKTEMQEAVNYIAGSFPVRLEKNSSIAGILQAAEFYGMGMDYIRNYQSIYRSVTLEQVNAAAKKFLHPDKYTLLIAGPYKEPAK